MNNEQNHTLGPWNDVAFELLEALESIEMIEPDDYGDRIIPGGFLDKARAAIAKARMRQK
jgi:hypothetical protein